MREGLRISGHARMTAALQTSAVAGALAGATMTASVLATLVAVAAVGTRWWLWPYIVGIGMVMTGMEATKRMAGWLGWRFASRHAAMEATCGSYAVAVPLWIITLSWMAANSRTAADAASSTLGFLAILPAISMIAIASAFHNKTVTAWALEGAIASVRRAFDGTSEMMAAEEGAARAGARTSTLLMLAIYAEAMGHRQAGHATGWGIAALAACLAAGGIASTGRRPGSRTIKDMTAFASGGAMAAAGLGAATAMLWAAGTAMTDLPALAIAGGTGAAVAFGLVARHRA